MLKRFAAKILRMAADYEKESYARTARESTGLERMFGDCSPAIVAFRIDNGYVVRTVDISPAQLSADRPAGFVYCKDHAAIADHIITAAAREKVMPKQHPLAYGSPHANQASSAKHTVR
jgi:hypothetical protein